jgi:penicillin-insensitive murein endopeptidase
MTSTFLNCFPALLAVFLLSISSPAPAATGSLTNPWADAREPVSGNAKAIGGYSAGCVQGAESILAHEGATFQVMRKSRHRHFAQPEMVDFIKNLASEIQQREFGTLLVGDLGQARGGPTTTGHASHQIGLDGDFWFWLDSPANHRTLTEQEVEQLSAISMLDQDRQGVDPKRFQAKHVSVLEYVSQQPEVARIFVHPLIKKAACEATDQAAWLNKLRPWWGHHYHFHVRLHCPAGQAACKPQPPPPDAHGCGEELAWWSSEEAAERLRKGQETSRKLTSLQRLARKLAKVPGQCEPLLQ